MGFWRDLFGLDDESVTEVAVYHATSLEGMKVATALQTASYFERDFEASAVYRGSQLLADLVAQLPWYSYRGGDPALSGQALVEEAVRLETQPELLLRPNAFEDRDDVLRQIVLSLIFHGNAYLHGSLFGEDGRPTNVTVVSPAEVTVTPNQLRTRAVYRWRDQTMRLGVDWWHIKVNELPGAFEGIGPLQAGQKIVAGIRASDEYARKLFTDSGVPAGVLTVPGKMTKDEADLLRTQWTEQHAGGRGTAILSGGIEFAGISLTPEQAQFLATRAFGAQEVSRLLGVPQWFLNAGSPPGTASALTYQNLNQVFVELTRGTLYPTYLRRIEKAFSALLPRGQSVRFDTTEFLKTDIEGRYGAYKTALEAGFLTVDEVRAAEGLPMIERQNA